VGVNLTKGGRIDLSKEEPGLNNVLVGLGWDPRVTDGVDFDLDASVFMLDAGDKCTEQNFIFYGNLRSKCDSILHAGDNRTGEGEGDDESIRIDLAKVPADIQKLVFVVTIHEADKFKQNFGQVGNAFIRLVNESNNNQVLMYELDEDYSTETAMIFGELYRHNSAWKFSAVGQGYQGGLAAMLPNYGLSAL
jgi:tellurium resistance protein TerD